MPVPLAGMLIDYDTIPSAVCHVAQGAMLQLPVVCRKERIRVRSTAPGHEQYHSCDPKSWSLSDTLAQSWVRVLSIDSL